MSNTIGQKIKVTVFGQSHADCIGCVIEGLPAGLSIDIDAVAAFCARRAPSQNSWSTARHEQDIPKIVSGVTDGLTCGAPVCIIIENHDAKSGDYAALRDVPRPSHADYPAYIKYNGKNDIRGGGQFSGRMTAPLCAAAAVCLPLLTSKGITIASHICSVGNVCDTRFDPVSISPADIDTLSSSRFPVLDRTAGEEMKRVISSAASDGDSVGGTVELAVTGLPIGLGDGMFGGIENRISAAVFGIPAVRGIEFGDGFSASSMRGSEHNDPYCIKNGKISVSSNHSGGVLGGMTTGMPLIFRVAIKPTPSISKPQQSVSLSRNEETVISIKGRHDACIVPRALVSLEAVTVIALSQLL